MLDPMQYRVGFLLEYVGMCLALAALFSSRAKDTLAVGAVSAAVVVLVVAVVVVVVELIAQSML